jgi:hypothetical protein
VHFQTPGLRLGGSMVAFMMLGLIAVLAFLCVSNGVANIARRVPNNPKQ